MKTKTFRKFLTKNNSLQACPYFRTPSNIENCKIMTLDEYKRKQKEAAEVQALASNKNRTVIEIRRDTIRRYIGWWIAAPVLLSTLVVFILGTFFYWHGMRSKQGRFEHVPGV
jgi:hypothetical protein